MKNRHTTEVLRHNISENITHIINQLKAMQRSIHLLEHNEIIYAPETCTEGFGDGAKTYEEKK